MSKMRQRMVDPGFLLNEELASLPPLTRLLFQGLWLIADREGRLKDRPRQIKAMAMPYDDLDPDEALQSLAGKGFIRRYEVEGEAYIEVVRFLAFQKPHPRETPSEIPPPPGREPEADPRQAQGKPKVDPGRTRGEPEANPRQPCGEGLPGVSVSDSVSDPVSVGESEGGADAPPGTPGEEELGEPDDVSAFIEAWNVATRGQLSVSRIPPLRRKAIREALGQEPDGEFWDRVAKAFVELREAKRAQGEGVGWMDLDWVLKRTKGYAEPNYRRLANGAFDFITAQAPRPAAPVVYS